MRVAGQSRSNDEWVEGLRRQPADPEVVADVRAVIARGLTKVLAGRGDVVPADIEDFTQDAVVRVLERLDSFRGDSRFTTWAVAIAIRVAYTVLRKRSWATRSLDALEREDGRLEVLPPAPLPDVAANSQREELHAALHRAIRDDLTERQRTLILAELEGIPAAMIVDRLKTNPNALYKLYHDARKKLLASLERGGFTAADVRSLLAETSKKS